MENKTVFIVERSGDVSHLDYENSAYLVAVTSLKANEIKSAQERTPEGSSFVLNKDGTWSYRQLPQEDSVTSVKNRELSWSKSEYENTELNLNLHNISHSDAAGTIEQCKKYMRDIYDYSKSINAITDVTSVPDRPTKEY